MPGSRSTRMARGTYLLPAGGTSTSITAPQPQQHCCAHSSLAVSHQPWHEGTLGSKSGAKTQISCRAVPENHTLCTAFTTAHTREVPVPSPGAEEGGNRLRGAVTCGLIVVHVDPLQLQVAVPVVAAGGVDAVLIADDLPELEEMFVKGQLLSTAGRCQSHVLAVRAHSVPDHSLARPSSCPGGSCTSMSQCRRVSFGRSS